jgi:hypothetical protein
VSLKVEKLRGGGKKYRKNLKKMSKKNEKTQKGEIKN